LLALGGEDVDVPRDEGTRAVDPVGAPTEDDKMLLDYLKHVSQPKVYFLIESTICDTDFCFCTGTCFVEDPDSYESFEGCRAAPCRRVGGGQCPAPAASRA
jgi:hypothetical protein